MLTVHGAADLLVAEEGARLRVRGGLHEDDGVPVVTLREARGRVGGRVGGCWRGGGERVDNKQFYRGVQAKLKNNQTVRRRAATQRWRWRGVR